MCATVIGWNTKNIKLNLILFWLCISLKYLIAIAQLFAERAANLEYLSFKAFESSGWVAMFIYICISTFGTKSETLGIAMVIGEQLNTPLPWWLASTVDVRSMFGVVIVTSVTGQSACWKSRGRWKLFFKIRKSFYFKSCKQEESKRVKFSSIYKIKEAFTTDYQVKFSLIFLLQTLNSVVLISEIIFCNFDTLPFKILACVGINISICGLLFVVC